MTVVRSAQRYGYWPYRKALQAAVDRLRPETAVRVEHCDIGAARTHLSHDHTEWLSLVRRIEDVIFLEQAIRRGGYHQGIEPVTLAAKALCAATMMADAEDGECPSCGATDRQRSYQLVRNAEGEQQ